MLARPRGGVWYLIMCGVDHLDETVEESTEDGSALPREDIEYALADFPESWAKGGYDRRRTGGDTTNGKAMNAMQNFGEVTRGLMGMYDPGTEENEWLALETLKWDRLVAALYTVSCFFKSQERICQMECDDILYELWWAWKNAFPEMKFNKFHGMFCGMRNFVHRYKSAGRFLEESCESYMTVLDNMKRIMRGVLQTEIRVNLIAARGRGDLKAGIYDPKMKILNKRTGAPRRPYKPRMRRDNNTKVVTPVVDVVVYEGENYVKLTNGTLIPEPWLVIYEWFAGKKAPQEWVDRMARSAPETRSDIEAAWERYSKW